MIEIGRSEKFGGESYVITNIESVRDPETGTRNLIAKVQVSRRGSCLVLFEQGCAFTPGDLEEIAKIARGLAPISEEEKHGEELHICH